MPFFDDRYSSAKVPLEMDENVGDQKAVDQDFETLSNPVDLPYDLPYKKKKTNKSKGVFYVLFVAVLVAASSFITAFLLNQYWNDRYSSLNKTMEESLAVFRQQISDLEKQLGDDGQVSGNGMSDRSAPGGVYSKNVHSVVGISCATSSDYFGQAVKSESSGSGFIFSEDGYIVTNYHVIEGAQIIKVRTHDDEEYEAALVGFERTNDIALLKIDAANLPVVAIGSSDELSVGDQVCAIGNPLGEFTSSMTVGYISAKDRIVTTDGSTLNMLQTDAAVNPGNSGGPLFNMNGELVGIITAKYSGLTPSGASIEGIGFAIPIDDVIDMLHDLEQYGYVTGAYLGVSVRNVDEVVTAYGIPEGAFVVDVTAGSAAQKAGIREADVIINLGGYEVSNLTELSRALRKFKAGESASITVYRSGQRLNLTVTFDEKPVDTQDAAQQNQVDPNAAENQVPDFFNWFD